MVQPLHPFQDGYDVFQYPARSLSHHNIKNLKTLIRYVCSLLLSYVIQWWCPIKRGNGEVGRINSLHVSSFGNLDSIPRITNRKELLHPLCLPKGHVTVGYCHLVSRDSWCWPLSYHLKYSPPSPNHRTAAEVWLFNPNRIHDLIASNIKPKQNLSPSSKRKTGNI